MTGTTKISGNTLTHTSKFNTNNYQIVDKIPRGFFVWNIGDNMAPGWLPICESANDPESPYTINATTLKAIKVDNAEELELLREAAGYGYNSKNAKKRAKQIAAKYMGVDAAAKVMDVFNRISE